MTTEMTFQMLVSLAGGYFIRYMVKELGVIGHARDLIKGVIYYWKQDEEGREQLKRREV